MRRWERQRRLGNGLPGAPPPAAGSIARRLLWVGAVGGIGGVTGGGGACECQAVALGVVTPVGGRWWRAGWVESLLPATLRFSSWRAQRPLRRGARHLGGLFLCLFLIFAGVWSLEPQRGPLPPLSLPPSLFLQLVLHAPLHILWPVILPPCCSPSRGGAHDPLSSELRPRRATPVLGGVPVDRGARIGLVRRAAPFNGS